MLLCKAAGTYENYKGQIATTSLRTGLAMTHKEVRCKITVRKILIDRSVNQ